MTKQRLPPLIALRAFEAVGRLGSVRAAGGDLGVSHTVVSRHVQNLQKDLNVKLLREEGRGLALTETGLAFHAQIAQAFELMSRATEGIRRSSRSIVRIWCTPGVAHRRLLSRLPELTGSPRNWEVNIQPTLAHPDLARAEADAEIVFTDVEEAKDELKAEVLVRPRVFPVASPACLARYPALKTLTDLSMIPLIHEESNEQWEHWFVAAGHANHPPLRGQRLWHAHLAIEASRLGQGIALANDVLVEDDLRSGALVEVFDTRVYMGAYQLIALRERWSDPMIVALRLWSKQALNAPSTGA